MLITDGNGCTLSDSVFMGVAGLPEASNVDLQWYPVPTSTIIKINQGVSEWNIYDAFGRLMASGTQSEINVADFPASVYVIEWVMNGAVNKQRFIKTTSH